MIDVTEVHKGNTKHSWISFVTQQTTDLLYEYLDITNFDYESDSELFSSSSRTVHNDFVQASQQLGMKIIPHLLRTMFTEKCTQAEIQEKYINAFCGRVSKSMLAKHYTDYSPNALKREYEKVESLLTLEVLVGIRK